MKISQNKEKWTKAWIQRNKQIERKNKLYDINEYSLSGVFIQLNENQPK